MSTDTMETTTVTVEPNEPVRIEKREATVMELANVIAGSRDFPDVRTPEKAAVRILAGREMGVGPIASVIGIRVQAGRVSMDATLMAGCIKRSGRYDYKITAHTNDVCAMVFFENGEPAGESAFSLADAKTAGLAAKDTWRQYPRNMMFARALSNGARWYCPAIFGGAIYTHEELGYTIDAEGRAIDADAADTANELCTRDQRQEISQLNELLGQPAPEYLTSQGIRLLDELSQREADKEIKRLRKKAEKAGKSVAFGGEVTPVTAPVEMLPSPIPAASAAPETLTPAQQTLADGMAEAAKPSTPEQREQLLALAEQLEPDETACREMLVAALQKRNCRKLAELNHLQAAGIIESVERMLAETPPFDPGPATGPLADPKTAAPLPEFAKGSKPK